MNNTSIEKISQKFFNRGLPHNKCVDFSIIKRFEEKNGIILPVEFTLFYSQICNGCEMIDDFWLKGLEEWDIKPINLQSEFPFADYWIWENDDDKERIQKTLFGNIELINIGDAQSWNLILNGSSKGEMWFFTDIGIQPCAPRMHFVEWFEYWLDGNTDYFSEFSL